MSNRPRRTPRRGITKRSIRGEPDWRKKTGRRGRPPFVIHEGRTTRRLAHPDERPLR